MEFEYKSDGKTTSWIIVIVFAAIGIVVLNRKEKNYNLYLIIMIINMIGQFIKYLGMKGKGMGVVDYLDYKHTTKSFITIYGIITFGIIICGENANFFLGALMIIITILLIIQQRLLKKSNITEDGGYPIDKIILNKEGIKIPTYKFIKWEDISNVIEYEAGRDSIVGVLVSNERAYKINTSKIEDLIFGKNVRLITIIRDNVSGKHGIGASELVVAIKENMMG